MYKALAAVSEKHSEKKPLVDRKDSDAVVSLLTELQFVSLQYTRLHAVDLNHNPQVLF